MDNNVSSGISVGITNCGHVFLSINEIKDNVVINTVNLGMDKKYCQHLIMLLNAALGNNYE